ncbi:unnamed protein product [Paramecium sonneborni]|uniref:Protein kinase domain-containing protein n=1 Tax=Paramecium sonneborni TaxID=65129 RepID=A0A8S1PLI4_9CILI|nr:unnamed protein product [Paramecium sonneborni]
MNYEVKIVGVEIHFDNVFYILRIINTQTSGHRDIRIKFSQLQELHSSLMQNIQNFDYDFPLFPNKQTENKEQILSEYFKYLIYRPPHFNKPLEALLRDGADIFRLKELTKEISSKQDLLKLIEPEKILYKSLFGKSTLCKFQGKKVILHKFYVLKGVQSDELFKNYLKTHLLFTDFTYICQVIHIFFLHAKFNLIDSIFSNTKQPRTCKKQHFQQVFSEMCKQNLVKLFSIEVYEGQNLEEIIKEKKMKKTPFTQYELLLLIQNLLEALIFLHNNECYPNRVTATDIIINKEKVKLTGINEPNEKYKERFIVEGYALRSDKEFDQIYIPPERMDSFQINPELTNTWQFGICILKAALLYTNRELNGIYQQNFVKELIQKIKNKYGEEIAKIIKLSLKESLSSRAEIKYLYTLATQNSIIPFQSVFLNQTQEESSKFFRINCLDQNEQSRLKDQLQKSTTISIKINLFEQEVETQKFETLMQLLGDLAIIKDLEIILNKQYYFQDQNQGKVYQYQQYTLQFSKHYNCDQLKLRYKGNKNESR